MKNIKYTIICLLIGLCITSCKKDSLMLFDESNYLYINLVKDAALSYPQRSFTFTFDAVTVNEKSFQVPVKFAGRFSDQDRIFKVSIVDSLTTAVNGTDFEIDPSSQKILAGKSDGFITLKLKRTDKMKTATYNIALKIEENENFKAGDQPIVKVLVSDRLIKPEWWLAQHLRLLGAYSDLKCRLWLEFMHVSDGSDPWAVAPYYLLTFNGLNYVPVVNEANAKSSLLSFKNWLRTEKGDPYDPDLKTTVVLSLGTSY